MNKIIGLFLLFATSFVFSSEAAPPSSLGSLFDSLTDVSAFIEEGLYKTADNIFQRMATWVIIWELEARLFILGFAVEVAELFVEALGISELLNSAFSSLDSRVSNFVTYLKIPEAINILLSAYATRFIMGLV